jgi:predicted proteasome-type protease
MWYMRNAKMFAKLGLVAQPGERVLVLVGSGHLYWLRHFVEQTGGYDLVEPGQYLREAATQLSETQR